MPESLASVTDVLLHLLPGGLWCVWWLFCVNWKKTWPVLSQGGWMPVVLLMVVTALAWSHLSIDVQLPGFPDRQFPLATARSDRLHAPGAVLRLGAGPAWLVASGSSFRASGTPPRTRTSRSCGASLKPGRRRPGIFGASFLSRIPNYRGCLSCGFANAISTPRPRPRRRSRRASPPTRSSFLRRRRPSRSSTRRGWSISATKAAQGQGLSRRAFLRTGSGMAAALLRAQPGVRRLLRGVGRRGRAIPRRSRRNGPRTSSSSTCKPTTSTSAASGTTTRRTARRRCSFFQHAAAVRRSTDEAPGAAQPGPLRQGSVRRQRHGDGDHQRRADRDWDKNPLPPDQMVATRKYVNDLAGSQRVLSHGLLRPNLGKKELDEMERQVKEAQDRRLEDVHRRRTGRESRGSSTTRRSPIPSGRRRCKLGIKNLCVHKGLPLGAFNEKACTPLDLEKAAKDLPGSELHRLPLRLPRRPAFLADGSRHRREGGGQAKTDDPQEIPWISDILRILKKNPKIKNIYFELGSTLQQSCRAARRRRACTCSAR